VNAASETFGGPDDSSPGGGITVMLEAVRRRALPMGIAFGAVLAVALLLATFWPATYLSTGTILIEQQEIPQDFVRSSVSSFADERVQVISQRVMTSANLLGIIEKFKLYGDERSSMTREALVERMRKDIELKMISADVMDPRGGGAKKATIAFSVGFESTSPELAARVANDVVSLYLSENLEARLQQVKGSADFLASEAEKMRLRVAELEQSLAEFKQKNYDKLPEFGVANLQSMSNAEAELREVDVRIRGLEQQVSFLDSQLAQVDPNTFAVSGSGERMMGPADRLKALRIELSAALSQYTEKHPIVIGLQQEIAELERMIAEGSTGQEAADNPAYIQLTSQRRAAASERDALRSRRAQLQVAVAQAQRAQAEMPAVERDYVALVREVQGEQAKYNELRQKQLSAELAQNLETEQKGERFSLIEPPVQPQAPIRPNRKAILALGLLFAVGAGVGLMALLEAVDTRVRGRRELMALVGVPPLAIIPWVAPDIDEHAKRKARLLFLAGAMGSAVVVVFLVHLLVKPLDVLWAVLLRRLGG
jgi:polysaccharide chain length determinant protein (PEP-CTERM system associated)